MTSTVQPNRCQGIIVILSGGTVGQFRKPAQRQKEESGNPLISPKGADPGFSNLPVFGG